jgi:hypothetical protein
LTDLRILLGAAALLLSPVSAHACLDAEYETYAFTLSPPLRAPDTVVVKLRIVRVDGSQAEAVLAEPFGKVPEIRRVIVETSLGNSCARWGATRGDVYAVVTSPRIEGHTLHFYAPQRQGRVARAERKWSVAELDSYIVDPAYRTPTQ